jgi:TolB-like protein/Tfp pilus assembly protein PilF
MGKEEAHRYSFGEFDLDQSGGVLLHKGRPVPLTQKQFDTLRLLVQKPGGLVRKEELMAKVWPRTCVEPGNLTQTIFVLRKVLAQCEPSGHFIETMARRGYRFVAPVKEVRVSTADLTVSRNSITDSRAVDDPKTGSDKLNSLAVMPFVNGTADPHAEYLSDGLTESIINSLSHLPDLRVLSRNTVFSYKAREITPQEIGRLLRVRLVLTGRILIFGDNLVIRAELVDALSGWQVWGEQYHQTLSDILTVQQEIAEEISTALHHRITHKERNQLRARYTTNAEAYRLYLKGRYHWNKFDRNGLGKALDYFRQAIEIDPSYALAYAGLADSYYRLSNVYAPTRDAMPKAKAAALKALEIDDTLSEAHAAMGLIKLFYEWDWSGAEHEFARALEINPNNALTHQRLALYFNLLGRFDEAARELGLALANDPLSPQTYWSFALTLFLTRQYEQAIEEIQKALELDRIYQPALYLLGRVYEALGELSEAGAVFENLLELNDAPMFLAARGRVHALAGDQEAARQVLNDLDSQPKPRYVSGYSKSLIHLALGNETHAFADLEEAYNKRCEMMAWLKVDPAFDGIRTDLRFVSLLRRVGLNSKHHSLQKSAVC